MDIFRELAVANRNLRQSHRDRLAALGIQRRTLYWFRDGRLAGHYGAARIEPRDDGTYEPTTTADAPSALILGVRPTDGPIFDLVAFSPSQPLKWWTRLGIATLLGEEIRDRTAFFGDPLVIHPTPLDWLRADADGGCILDWRCDLRLLLGGCERIIVYDDATAERLSEAFRANLRLPEIRVSREHVRHAA